MKRSLSYPAQEGWGWRKKSQIIHPPPCSIPEFGGGISGPLAPNVRLLLKATDNFFYFASFFSVFCACSMLCPPFYTTTQLSSVSPFPPIYAQFPNSSQQYPHTAVEVVWQVSEHLHFVILEHSWQHSLRGKVPLPTCDQDCAAQLQCMLSLAHLDKRSKWATKRFGGRLEGGSLKGFFGGIRSNSTSGCAVQQFPPQACRSPVPTLTRKLENISKIGAN